MHQRERDSKLQSSSLKMGDVTGDKWKDPAGAHTPSLFVWWRGGGSHADEMLVHG